MDQVLSAEEQANEILSYEPDHGFWRSGTSEAIVRLRDRIMAHAISEEVANDLVQSIWDLACGEYGD